VYDNFKTLDSYKFHSFGALGNDGIFCCRFYDNANTDSFLDFIAILQKQYGKKLLLFADNVSYHKSNKVKKFLKESKRNIIIRHIHLNSIQLRYNGEGRKMAMPIHSLQMVLR